jgi:hypothetical protein
MDELAARLAEDLEDGGTPISIEARQRLLAALVRAYVSARENGEAAAPFADGDLTAEEVVVIVAAMMQAAEVTSFEVAALFGV